MNAKFGYVEFDQITVTSKIRLLPWVPAMFLLWKLPGMAQCHIYEKKVKAVQNFPLMCYLE